MFLYFSIWKDRIKLGWQLDQEGPLLELLNRPDPFSRVCGPGEGIERQSMVQMLCSRVLLWTGSPAYICGEESVRN